MVPPQPPHMIAANDTRTPVVRTALANPELRRFLHMQFQSFLGFVERRSLDHPYIAQSQQFTKQLSGVVTPLKLNHFPDSGHWNQRGTKSYELPSGIYWSCQNIGQSIIADMSDKILASIPFDSWDVVAIFTSLIRSHSICTLLPPLISAIVFFRLSVNDNSISSGITFFLSKAS